MKIPKNSQYVLFGGTFILANKLQYVADRKVEGLSVKQWFLLRVLHDMPPEPAPTVTMLAKETDTTRQNAAKMLDLLQRDGYVIISDNPHDGRSSTIAITEQGRQILGTMASASAGFFRELFANISNDECEAAAKVVIKMIDKLNEMQKGLK
jgi:DNA-binding MarR family transcriptional regulator